MANSALRPTIDRCVCQRAPFSALLDLARHHDWSLEQLIEQTGCGDQCGMCRPYLRQMLSDGTTVFHHLLPLDEEAP
jgi:bacterioferritin-associated ferredoxin